MNAPTEQEIRESLRRDFNPNGTPRDLAALLDNAQAQINQLRDWLAAHPHPSTADGRQAQGPRACPGPLAQAGAAGEQAVSRPCRGCGDPLSPDLVAIGARTCGSCA